MHALRTWVGRYGHWFVLASLCSLVALALVGESMQEAVVGPAFIRFHLSDFCAPAYSCFVTLILFAIFTGGSGLRTYHGKRLSVLMLTLVAIVATVYWCYDEMFVDTSTDPIDIVAFILGGIVSLALALCLLWSAYEQKRLQRSVVEMM